MNIFSYCIVVAARKVGVHSLRPLREKKGNVLVVGIPGGPGISGRYLDSFVAEISAKLNCNGVVFDLPNHGDKAQTELISEARYPAVVEALGEALGELGENRLLLVGHSYGARLALDLMGAGSFNLIGGILLSLPTSWGSSPRFKDGIRAMGLSEVKIDQESDFKSYWRKILPLYFSSGVPSVSAEIALTTKTFWKASQKMTEGLPTLDLTATALANRRQVPILYLEGDEDARLPAGNMGTLQNAFPFWDYHLLSNCGHFPMIERPVETLAEAGEFISKIGIGKL